MPAPMQRFLLVFEWHSEEIPSPVVIIPIPMTALDVQDISQLLPHRYPMLMVDRIVEISADSIVGLKNVTVIEPHFTGHFPGFPVMPGVLIIEAMAQVAGILVGT